MNYTVGTIGWSTPYNEGKSSYYVKGNDGVITLTVSLSGVTGLTVEQLAAAFKVSEDGKTVKVPSSEALQKSDITVDGSSYTLKGLGKKVKDLNAILYSDNYTTLG